MTMPNAIHAFLRYRVVKLTLLALFCSAAVPTDFAPGLHAETVPPASQTSPEAQKTENRAAAISTEGQAHAFETSLAVGDRIRIGFFETFDVPQTSNAAGTQPSMRTFYQRLDLSGEYSIQQDGTIAMPKLGTFRVAGRSVRNAQLDIAVAFEKTMNRRCDINIAILEREPVYILGPLKNPGVYKFVPGMTVLHAVAVAGGMDRGAEQFNRAMDLLRERKEANDVRDKLSRALAQRARLEAERDDLEKPPLSDRLAEVAGKERAEGLLAAESTRLDHERLTFKEESAKRSDDVAHTKLELSMLQAKIASNAQQLKAREKRVALLQNSGTVVLAATVIAAENEKLDLEARQQETLLAIENAKQKLVQLERAAMFYERDRKARIARELAGANEEITTLEKALQSSSTVANVIQGSLVTQFGSSQAPLNIEIIRQGMGGRSIINAEETSLLEPGDLVRMKISGSGPDTKDGDANASTSQAF